MLVAQIAQLGLGILAPRRRQFQHLDADFGHPALGLGGAGGQFTQRSGQPRLFALERQHPAGFGQSLVQQALLVCQLLPDQVQLGIKRLLLRLYPIKLAADLRLALFQRLDLFAERRRPRLEQLLLTLDLARNLGVGRGGGKDLCRIGDDRPVVALSLHPALPGLQFEILAFDNRQFRPQQPAVQPDQRITGGDQLTLGDQNRRNHAAIGMLHHLAVLLDLQLPRGDNRPRQRGEHAPAAKAADQHHQRQPAGNQGSTRRPDAGRRRGATGGHHRLNAGGQRLLFGRHRQAVGFGNHGGSGHRPALNAWLFRIKLGQCGGHQIDRWFGGFGHDTPPGPELLMISVWFLTISRNT